MKLKRFVGILAAVAIIASSSTGFAATWRHSRKGQAKLPDRGGKNDYFYEDFSGTEPGTLPAGMTGGSNSNGYITTEVTDIGGGVMKNCFKLVDESHETGVGSTPSSVINLPNYKGLVGIDIRFKYVPTSDESLWSSFVIAWYSPEGMISRTACASGGGAIHFNYGGQDSTKVTPENVKHDNWYTLRAIVDFDLALMDAEFTDDGTNQTTQLLDKQFYSAGTFSNLSKIDFRSSEYGGSWYIDYIKVYKASERFEEKIPDVKKGSAEPDKVPGPKSVATRGRTNIVMDGKYKFTTKAPKVTDGNVLVTAKNVASFFNLAYAVTDSGEVIKTDSAEYTVTEDGIKKDSSAMMLSASPVKDGAEIFIPIGDIAKELGYEYSYDAAANVATITKPVAEEEVK